MGLINYFSKTYQQYAVAPKRKLVCYYQILSNVHTVLVPTKHNVYTVLVPTKQTIYSFYL